MKHFILTFMCLITLPSMGQLVTVEKHYSVDLPAGTDIFHPVFTPDGTQILFTSENYTGLSVLDLKSKSVSRVSDEAGAGFEPVYDAETNQIYYQTLTKRSGRVYKTLNQYDVERRNDKKLSGEVRDRKQIRDIRNRALSQNKNTSTQTVDVTTENLRIIVTINGKSETIQPVGEVPGYIWVSLSPDKQKILFTAVSKGTYVCDLAGNIITRIGYLNAPVWYGNDYVVGMEDKDDGESLISSEVVIFSLDKKEKQLLTPSDRIALYPATSAETNRIAYTTGDGRLYVMEISK